ncbi:MAG: sensor histidine kinase [Propionivibrio sp.]|jgi:two-component system sensor histidine kinase YesM|nr:sensor histidine kinase [Propionivibrio sp.]MBP6711329.1 sensor histidine kinase [Propionivibrio sp.]
MFDEHWHLIKRLLFCLGGYALLGLLFFANDLLGGGATGLLAIVFVANSLYFYRSILLPLRTTDAAYLRFNRGYDSKAIFNRPIFFTPAEKQSLAKIAHLLDNQEVNRLSNRQAQYLALQNQINPHFLYNTLEAIRGDALSVGMRDVASITEALATFFRYTISNMDNLVSLAEELSNAENYFAIQNYRFGDRIRMEVTIEPGSESAMDFMIPKLTLQPIIENAIIHGLEGQVGPGTVAVDIATDGSRLTIDVKDDGLGMSENVLEEIGRRLVFPEALTSRDEKHRPGGIALANVNNRIKLLFGEQYGLRVSSIKGTGTKVEIQLPVRRSADT